MIDVVCHNEPYRYVEMEELLDNGKGDYRIQKYNQFTGRYKDMYLCDNFMQFQLAIDDFEYTKWLDPARVPCYIKDD
tara:strand:+ start:2650 stop:2880 length:231 start_codon:yes stop_codon:yes gene_type:complete